MTDRFVIEVDKARTDAWFGELLRRGESLGRLMEDIGETLRDSTQMRLNAGIAPDGTAWAPLADGSGRTPLVDSGAMRDGIFPRSDDNWVEISSGAKQARWHQEGTDPYVILAKPGKALAWPGMRTRTSKAGKEVPGYVTKVNHPGLPARPFMGLSADDLEQIDGLAIAWLDLSA